MVAGSRDIGIAVNWGAVGNRRQFGYSALYLYFVLIR